MAMSVLQWVPILLLTGIISVYGYKGGVKFLADDGTDFNSPYEGVVQIEQDGVWGGICYNFINEHEAQLICKALGYKLVTRFENARDDIPDHGNDEVLADDIYCPSWADDLSDCTITSQKPDCSTKDVLAIACSHITDYAVRLKGGSSWYEGRVEVYHASDGHKHWGTVCNDFWGKNDAKVVCRQLQYGNPEEASIADGDYYKSGSAGMPVLLDNVHCHGSESSLEQCPANNWHDENCFWNTDLAAVICEPAKKLGLTTAAIAGIVVGSIVVFSFIVIVSCICYRQSQDKKRRINRRAAVNNTGEGGVTYMNQGETNAGGVAFITPGQYAPGQGQPQQYYMPGAAAPPLNPPPYYPPGAAYAGDGGNKPDDANPPPTNDD